MDHHTSSSGSSSSTTGGNSSGKYPDLVLQRGRAGASNSMTTPTNSINPPHPPSANTSRLSCSSCSDNSVINSCSCSSRASSSSGHQANMSERRESSSNSNTKSPTVIIEVGEVQLGMDTNNTTPDFIAKSISEQNVNEITSSRTKFKLDPSIKCERKWEYFPGKNKFYFNGRLMTAPSIRFCMLSFILILVTFVLFTAFDGPFLAKRLTPLIPVIGSILFFLVIVNMLKTSCSDPGILPRASAQESEFIIANAGEGRPPPRTRDIIVRGQTIKSKYCFTCKMFRPPRASHCGVCDNCVDRFDHHCPFLGNCIGKRNYRNFYTFIVSLSLLAVFVLSCSITKLALLGKDKGNFLDALRESPTSAIVILISFLGMWTVIGLAGFHTYLIAVEQTTNEDIKGMFGRANAVNPYTRGNFCRNCCFILCGPHQPSLIDSRGIVTSEFLASLPKKSGVNEENTSVAPCSLPPPTIRPHCGEGSNTPRNGGQEQFLSQISASDPGGQKSRHISKVQYAISPTNSSSPVVINSRNVGIANIPKANTVPESSMMMTSSQALSNQSSEGLSLPIYNNSNNRKSYHLSDSDSLYSPAPHHININNHRQQEETCELGSLSTPASTYELNSQSKQHRKPEEDMSLSTVRQLDFPPEYNINDGSSQLRHSNNQSYRSHQQSTSITSAPLIASKNIPNSNKDFMYPQNSNHRESMLANGHQSVNRLSSPSHAPVSLSFYEYGHGEDDPANLEQLTMINSPLDLDNFPN